MITSADFNGCSRWLCAFRLIILLFHSTVPNDRPVRYPDRQMVIEKINYQGWPDSYRISNGEVEAVITSAVGPRVMRYGFVGGQNFFKEFTGQLGKSGEPDWQPRGGHRLWIAPEDAVRSYAPDNGPVHIAVEGDVLTATQPVEPLTGIEKQIAVKMAPSGTGVEVIHRLRNAG